MPGNHELWLQWLWLLSAPQTNNETPFETLLDALMLECIGSSYLQGYLLV
jgi:hypothetical protein